MNFGSDNMGPVAPEIMAAIAAANEGMAAAYGADEITTRLEARFSELFEIKIRIFPVVTGGAANSIALAALSPPWGSIFCHAESHINVDECGGPEFYSGGAKLITVPGEDAKFEPAALAEQLKAAWIGVVHSVQPAAVSITQSSECGAVYTPDEVAAISEVTKEYGLGLHMDGARFANAVSHLGCTPAEITWRTGVDILSFGATKGGAMAAEAIIVFGDDPGDDLCQEIEYRRKRGGHLLSKMRYCSAQLETYIRDGLWLRLAANANAMAKRLSDGLAALPGTSLAHPTQANEVFITLPEPLIAALQKDGFGFHRWGDRKTSNTVRLVTCFDTSAETVDELIAAAKLHLGRG
ncbi:MAG: low specificity L-threonine aldolase [Alphaproteobacteria bacterium]|nr:low specificity L-threonine aldolase [Alphaproteobacteria bacterium]